VAEKNILKTSESSDSGAATEGGVGKDAGNKNNTQRKKLTTVAQVHHSACDSTKNATSSAGCSRSRWKRERQFEGVRCKAAVPERRRDGEERGNEKLQTCNAHR